MKGKIFLIIFMLLGVFIFAQPLNGVLFTNSTGYDLTELYVSPTSHDDWYDDLLNGQTLPDGETITVNIPDYEDSELVFDAMAVDADGDEYSKFEIDLSDENKRSIDFTFDDYDDSSSSDNGDYSSGDYDTGYQDGYRDAFRDAYSEAFKEGYSKGMEDSRNLQ